MVRHGGFALAGLVLLAVPTIAWAAPPAPIEASIVIDAPREAVWARLTTADGMETFFAPEVQLDPRVDGVLNVHFAPANPPGLRGAEGMRVLAFEPGQRFAFTWDAPPYMPYVRGQRAMVEIALSDADSGRTNVTLRHFGFGETHQEWAMARDYFAAAWPVILRRLQYSVAHGALDFDNLPPELGHRAPTLEELRARIAAASR